VKTLEFRIKIESAQRTLVLAESFTLQVPGINILLGESGIGKTLIAQAIYGLLDPQDLNIEMNNQPYSAYLRSSFVHTIRENGFFVFQEPSSHFNPMLTLAEQINEGVLGKAKNETEIFKALWPAKKAAAPQEILRIYPKPYRPSGGEKQRLLLTMAFKKISLTSRRKERVFIFDEPTGNLDDAYRNRVLQLLLKYYRKKPFTILLITHDYSIIGELFRTHGDLMPAIFLRELKRGSAALVQQKEFTVQTYINWINKLQAKNPKSVQPKIVLDLDSGFKTIGKTFRLYRDSALRRQTALRIRSGELVYLKAPSGAGKTTLAKVVLGLIQTQELNLRLCGTKLSAHTPLKYWQRNIWGKKAAMVFQHADETLDRQSNVLQVFKGLPLTTKNPQALLLSTLRELFEKPPDEMFLKQKVGLLSGGQKQKLNILRALLLDVEFLILDEPLNGLDFASIDRVLNLLQQKRRQQCAILLISHNEEIFNQLVIEEQVYYLESL